MVAEPRDDFKKLGTRKRSFFVHFLSDTNRCRIFLDASNLTKEALLLLEKDELPPAQWTSAEENCVTLFRNDNRIFGESEVLKKETYMSVKQVLKNRYSVWKKQVLEKRYTCLQNRC